jgi:hypothetical protein
MISSIGDFLSALGIEQSRPVALVVHGFVLSQYALLWALKVS